MDIVNIACGLPAAKLRMEDHDGASMNQEAHLMAKGTVQARREVVQNNKEFLPSQEDVVVRFDSGHGGE